MTDLKNIVKREIYAIDSKTGQEVKERQYYIQTEYLPNVNLKQIFQSVEIKNKYDTPYLEEILKNPHKCEIYLSISANNGKYESRSVKITSEFRDWLNNRLHFSDLHPAFELRQQTNNKDKWLLIYHYSEILGDTWLSYISDKDIKEFFKI